MSFGRGQLDMLPANDKLIQIRIGLWHEIDEPCIQAPGSYSVHLLQTRRRLKLQIHIGLLLPKSPEGIWSDAVPGRILGEADAQRP
jgi:hypothetical protein